MEGKIHPYQVKDLLDLRKNKMLAVNPEYQRGEVWTQSQKKKLIDSILRGYPIPLIYLHHIKTEVAGMKREDLEIIDGQQRINSFYEFAEGAFKLFDPIKDDKEAKFPIFLKNSPCPWAGQNFQSMSSELQDQFLETILQVVEIRTDEPNEARDLFIRLQAGLPLNPQEKRDAWPGNFTEFALRQGGKTGVAKYPGHDFFKRVVRIPSGGRRGESRQLCAQMAMLFYAKRDQNLENLVDINAKSIDDFYYQHLDFEQTGPEASRFIRILDKLTDLLGDGKRRLLKLNESYHLMLLVDSLLDDYAPSWEENFPGALDQFLAQLAAHTKEKDSPLSEFWIKFGVKTRVNSDRGSTIGERHEFFVQKMIEYMAPIKLKDPVRLFGEVEREIIFYRDKTCADCGGDVRWIDTEIHHVEPHSVGGKTNLSNGVLVHAACHPKSAEATRKLALKIKARQEIANSGDTANSTVTSAVTDK